MLVLLLIALSFQANSTPIPALVPATAIALSAPQLKAKPSLVGAISLTWSKADGATGYVLEKSNTGNAGTFVQIATISNPDVLHHRDATLYYSQTAYYRIKAIANGAESGYSAVASATSHPAAKAFNILPLGDSNTEGGGSAIAVDDRAGYRDKLEVLLNNSITTSKYEFVGSEKSGSNYVTDTDHGGFGGARDEDIALLLKDGRFPYYNTGEFRGPGGGFYLDKYNPDIILLHIGTNQVDGSAGSINDVVKILDQIDQYEERAKKEVTVVLAKIILTAGDNPALDAAAKSYNNYVRSMAEKRVQAGDRIIFVDMEAGAGLIYDKGPGGDFIDNLHPNGKGYDKMAQEWFEVLEKLLNVTPQPTDTQDPETTIATKPAALSNKATDTFTFTSNESGVTFQVKLDGAAAFTNATTPYTVSGLTDGQHTLLVRAVDQAGNIDDTPAAYTWTIDTKAPAAPVVLTPKEGALLNNPKPTISGTAEAGSKVTVAVDGKNIGSATAAADGKWNITSGTALAEGEHTVAATAADAAGNNSPKSNSITFTIDSKAPQTTIVAKPAAVTNKDSFTFTFSSDKANVTYQVKLDGGSFADAVTPYPVQDLSDGSHTLAVRAVDAAGNTDASPATYTWVVDTKAPAAPAITKITEDKGPDANDRITSDNTPALAGTAEAGAEVTVYKEGTTLGTVTADGTGNWTYSAANALAEGTHSFTAAATDAAGNTGPKSAAVLVQVDVTAPTVNLTSSSKSSLKEQFAILVTFSEEVFGVAAGDFTITNGTLSNLSSSNKKTYTATVTPSADGTVRVQFAAGKATDLAGNLNGASNALERQFDGTAPEVVLTTDALATTNAPFSVTFTFSEAVTGFEAADITIANGAAADFTKVSATRYTATITPTADGDVSIRVGADKAFDAAENGNKASAELKRKYDAQRPTVVLSTEAKGPINAPFTVQVSFSEQVVNFAASDVRVLNGAASQLSKVNGQTYTIVITPTANGNVAISMAANVVQDQAANGNEASNELILGYDAERPTISISTGAPAKTNQPFTVTFNFSEPVTGFELADLTLANASATNFIRVTDQQYTALISPSQDGAVTVSVPANKAQDAATNGNTASSKLERQYDTTAPAGYAIAFSTEKIDVENQADIALQVTGAEVGATYTYTISSGNGGSEVTGTANVNTASFTIPALNLTGLRDGLLTVRLYLVDALGNKGVTVTDEVEKLTKNVSAIASVARINVPYKTAFKDVPLPAQVEVTFTNGEKENLNVTWNTGNYNGEVPALYELTGKLQLPENASNTGNMLARATVEVAPNQPPTALQLSDSKFRPDITPGEAIGKFSTTDPDDSSFTYNLVSGNGDAHNNLFQIENSDELHLVSSAGLSGISTFTVRVSSKDPYNNTIEQIFTLTKTIYEPQEKLKLVNAFSPNNDGRNDTWTVPELQFYNQVEVEVFDRSGVRLFKTNNPEEGWDGRGANGKVQAGSYFYIIQIKDINLVQKGVVTILK